MADFLTESAEDKAAFDQMRADDSAPVVEEATEATETPAEPVEAPETEEKRDENKVVNLGALHEERQRRQEFQRKAQELESKVSEMERAFQEMSKRLNPEEPIPDFDENPAENLKAQIAAAQKRLEAIESQGKQSQEQTQQRENFNRFVNQYQAQAAQFAQKQPDFMEAYQHIRAVRRQQLEAVGYTDPAGLEGMLQQEELQIAGKAFQDGVNPAERLYALAKQLGYSGKQAENKLQTIAEGQTKGRSLSGPSGSPGDNAPMTLERLSKLEGAEFDAAFEKWAKSERARDRA